MAYRSKKHCGLLFFLFVFVISMHAISADIIPIVEGIRPENAENMRLDEEGMLMVMVDTEVTVRLFGQNLNGNTIVAFTKTGGEKGSKCPFKESPFAAVAQKNTTSVLLTFSIKPLVGDEKYYFMCVRNSSTTDWVHQGTESFLRVGVDTKLLPVWLHIIFLALLLVFSGLFSGLNLGLMALDKTELKVIENSGSDHERKWAKEISPVRKRGNFLLCSLLLGNVLVNSTLTILLDDLTTGIVAVITSTMAIVIFGEIVPQAICSRHGLAVGAKTIWLTKIFMVVTFPLSFPISLLLDCILGEEIGQVYNRERLQELIKVTDEYNDLRKEEVNIISGALALTMKRVEDIMTPIDDVYMIAYSSVLDFETITEMTKTGFTRVPVYENERTNILGLLNIKDLALVDPDDRTPLKTLCKFYNHPVIKVFNDTTLDAMLEEFKKGHSHMAVVQEVNNVGEGDPYYETLGVVTLEDIIEEIIQCEILDETDTLVDNKTKKMRKVKQQDFSVFNTPQEGNSKISPQLALAMFQYLSTSLDLFKEENLSETVLRRLIRLPDVIYNLKHKPDKPHENFIYQQGKPCDYFVLILQGKAQVEVGKEKLVFEAGPFMFFGVQALTGIPKQNSVTSMSSVSETYYQHRLPTGYVPDFTVKALENMQYMLIRRAQYIAARRAAMMEKSPKTPDVTTEDPFMKEWKKASVMQANMLGEGVSSTEFVDYGTFAHHDTLQLIHNDGVSNPASSDNRTTSGTSEIPKSPGSKSSTGLGTPEVSVTLSAKDDQVDSGGKDTDQEQESLPLDEIIVKTPDAPKNSNPTWC